MIIFLIIILQNLIHPSIQQQKITKSHCLILVFFIYFFIFLDNLNSTKNEITPSNISRKTFSTDYNNKNNDAITPPPIPQRPAYLRRIGVESEITTTTPNSTVVQVRILN